LADRWFDDLSGRREESLLVSFFTIHSGLLYYQLNVVSNISFYLTSCLTNFYHQKNRFLPEFNLTISIKNNNKNFTYNSDYFTPFFFFFIFYNHRTTSSIDKWFYILFVINLFPFKIIKVKANKFIWKMPILKLSPEWNHRVCINCCMMILSWHDINPLSPQNWCSIIDCIIDDNLIGEFSNLFFLS